LPSERPLNARGQLIEVFLAEVHFRRNPEFDYDEHAGAASFFVESMTRADVSDERTEGETALEASVKWRATDGSDTPIVQPFDINVTVVGRFEWQTPDMEVDEIRAWLEFNGEFLLWPYLRGYVGQITAQSDLPALHLPTLSLPRPRLGRTDIAEPAAPADA
jgi:hypothetical protein